MSQTDKDIPAADLATAPETKRFAPGELLTCDSCQRANAPTRTQCMYCGAALRPVAALSPGLSPAGSEPEPNQIYIVARVRGGQSIAGPVVDQIAERFRLAPAELHSGINTGAPLPLTIASREQTPGLLSELQGHGLETFSIQESDIKAQPGQVKIRALQLTGATLGVVTASPARQVSADWRDLALIVSGRLQTNRVEVDERQSGASVKNLDRRELTDDESVLDLYMKSGAAWRIGANEFDFSCLGAQKTLTAFENLRALIQLLLGRSDAELNDAYARLRPLLTRLWPPEMTSSKSRSRRPRASRKDVSIVTASDNTTQFNNYSHLLWSVKLSELRNQ
ncbi:MAG TPA: hypothetical protein VE961_24075 [Pyrinomonadaceae bacterium]|nr:hypothetical protein [Pyrinomonadaceae bacterium]